MAKLKGPLFSLAAAGKIADTLVYFGWKGLDVVRQYVIPANPRSDRQIVQRDFLKAAVLEVHNAMVYLGHPLTSDDKSAYALAGSLHPTPRTWFNEAVKIMVDAMVDAQSYAALVSLAATYKAATTADVVGWSVKEATLTGFVKYGVTKSALINSVAANIALHTFTAVMTGLSAGVTYFWQWQAPPVEGKTVLKSGIYTYKHEA